jgi:hypothetical protein
VFALAGAVVAFVPTSHSSIVEPLTRGSLHGDISVISFGVAKISADCGDVLPVLHVRETFDNRADDVPWTVELGAATVSYGDSSPAVHPLLVNSDLQTLPVAVIGRGQKRVVDLYFPTPSTVTGEETLAMFALSYRVNTPDVRYEARAMFAPSTRSARADERAPEPGWARYWWADPTYAWTAYHHHPGYLLPRPPTRIAIVSSPGALYEELPATVPDENGPLVSECEAW